MIELKPDKRHLTGGLVAACLLAAYLVFAGTTDPGGVYYKPAYSSHTGNKYDEVQCKSCHEPFKPHSDALCVACHYKLDQMVRLPAARQVRPDVTASALLHVSFKGRACSECHVEHGRTDLAEALKQKLDTKKSPANYFALVHDGLPAPMKGQDKCAQCHTPQELETKQ